MQSEKRRTEDTSESFFCMCVSVTECKALNRVEIGSRNKKQRCPDVRGIIQAAMSPMIPFFSRAPRRHFPSSARLIPLLTARGKTNGTDKLQRGSRIAMRAANRARR